MAKSAKKAPKKASKKASKPAPRAKAKSKAAAPKKASAKKVSKKPVAKAAKPVKKAAAPSRAKTSARAGAIAQVFTPLDNRILVEKTGAAQRTPGGLYIPETVSNSDRPTEGRVVAVGRGHIDKKGRLHPLDVKVGDTVMFNAYTGSDVRIADSDFLCLREEEILAIVKG